MAQLLALSPGASMSTAAHPIESESDFRNPNIVKVVLNARQHALYFSRSAIPYAREGRDGWQAPGESGAIAGAAPLRHVGIYGYRAGFLRRLAALPRTPLERAESLEQLRVLEHGYAISVQLTPSAPAPGVDTPEDLARVRALLS